MNQKSEDYLTEWFRAGPLADEPESLHEFRSSIRARPTAAGRCRPSGRSERLWDWPLGW